LVVDNSDNYEAGYRQAVLDMANFVKHYPLLEMNDARHMIDFWTVLTTAEDSSLNRFHMVLGGYRIALRELEEHITKLSQHL